MEHLESEEDIAAYLEAVFEEGDPFRSPQTRRHCPRKGMAQIARDTGSTRESLYKALSSEGNPEFATIMKVVSALACCMQLHQP